jgi:DNA polymerase III subunit epsilon
MTTLSSNDAPYLVFYDTETSGIPLWNDPSEDPRQPHILHLVAIKTDLDLNELDVIDMLIKPEGYTVDEDGEAFKVNGITQAMLDEKGISPEEAVDRFLAATEEANQVIGHNESFDRRMVRIALKRAGREAEADAWKEQGKFFCTMWKSVSLCAIPKAEGKKGFKTPSLSEAYKHFTGKDLNNAHKAVEDVRATIEVYRGIKVAETNIDPFA